MPQDTLPRRFERFLQTHARQRQQIRTWFLHILGKRRVELARGLQLGRTLGTSPEMLLDLVTGVVFELVVNVEQNILSYPITFHVHVPSREQISNSNSKSSSTSKHHSSHLRQRRPQFLRRTK